MYTPDFLPYISDYPGIDTPDYLPYISDYPGIDTPDYGQISIFNVSIYLIHNLNQNIN